MADLPIRAGDVEIDPRMRIDQIDTRQLGLKLNRLGKVVLRPAVMSEGDAGQQKYEQEHHGRIQHRSPHFPTMCGASFSPSVQTYSPTSSLISRSATRLM